MRGARTEPLWRIDTQGATIARASEIARAEASQIADFLVAHSVRLAAIAVAAFALALMLVVAARKRLAKAEESLERETPRLFEAPVTAAIMLALLMLAWLGPAAPASYYEVLLSLMLIPAALLARALFARQASLSLFMLTAAMVSLGLVGPIVDPLPLQGRLLLIAQCIAVGAGLIVDVRRGTLMAAVRWSPVTTRRVALIAIVLLMLAVLAAVAGYTGPARVLRNAVLGAGGLALLVVVATQLLYELVAALSETRLAQRLRIVRNDPAAVRRASLTALHVVGWIAWVFGMLILVGRLDWLVQLVRKRRRHQVQDRRRDRLDCGDLRGSRRACGHVRAGEDPAAAPGHRAVAAAQARAGVSFAVSAVIRYCFITAGVLLAMAAMGIDLTKVTLLAGAIGVGVGLGLQSVVNNFVSGLILLVERPISAGDAVQIGDANGVVQSIGVRSSMIRTSQGAEVIVPNADLISKVVTNWTLSDRTRRVEIDVGVALETAPETVIRFLETAAAGVEGIIAKPPPRARLSGLGADPTYRLYAWIADIDRASEIQGALRIAIAKKFSDAGIEIK